MNNHRLMNESPEPHGSQPPPGPLGRRGGSRSGMRLVPRGVIVRGAAFAFDTSVLSLVAAVLVRLGVLSTLTLEVYALVVPLLYFTAFEGTIGTTPGKRFLGMRVVSAAGGGPCGLWAAFLRNLVRIADNLIFFLPGVIAIIASPANQRLGDRVARTLVVTEVSEQYLAAMQAAKRSAVQRMGGRVVGRPLFPSDVFAGGAAAVEGETLGSGTPVPGLAPCPVCEASIAADEVVCPQCRHYVNQVTASGEAEDLAPVPMLYATDRGHRFDALWRLVFAADESSLASVKEAVLGWPDAERMCAIEAFSQVDDPRPAAFLAFMSEDRDPAVGALAAQVIAECDARAASAASGSALE